MLCFKTKLERKLFNKGRRLIKQDMNLFRMVQMQKKVQAVLSVIVNHVVGSMTKPKLIEDIKKTYLQFVTITENNDYFKLLQASDPLVKFLNRDEKQQLYHSNDERRNSTIFKLQSFIKKKFKSANESSSASAITSQLEI